MQPDFSTLKEAPDQPDFSTLKPVTASTQTPASPTAPTTSQANQFGGFTQSLSDKVWSSISGAFNSGVQQAKSGYQQAQTATNPLQKTEAGLQELGGTANAAFSPLAPIFSPISKAIGGISDSISNSPLVQKFAMSPAGAATSRVAQDVNNTATLLPLAAGVTSPGRVSSEATQAATNVKTALVGTSEERAAAAAQALQKSGISDATPAYNPKLIKQPAVNGIPRVQEGEGLTQRTVTATDAETAAGTELAKVKGYDPKATSLDKYNLVQQTIISKAQDLVSSLQKENVVRPSQEVLKVVSDAVDKVPDESLLIQDSDPLIGNYMRVVNNALSKTDGTLAGELQLRKTLDSAYSNARGKLAFGSDKISALDDLHTAVRDALNQDMIAHAKSTNVKASLKAQSDLYKASDVLLQKSEKEGGSKIEQLMKAHPLATKVGKAAGRAAGIGAGVHLLP